MAPSRDVRVVESRWSEAWERDGCYRAPDLPGGPKFFNYDSGPFPNGPLHLGHVRTYLLGDVTARYQRALGKSVLYCTEWDAFGLPNELAAIRAEVSPAVLTERSMWLFLRLHELGLIRRRGAKNLYCPDCKTVLPAMQVEEGRCWRCGTEVKTRRRRQWFVSVSRYGQSLLDGLDRLEGWSPQVRNLVRGLMHSREGRAADDWLISRQRAWGTPIPIVFCDDCGSVPVPEEELPVRLPDDLDWSLGAEALSTHEPFVKTDCPRCGGPGQRETDTLDCFFDDVWCFLACLVDLDGPPSFRGRRVESWMPVDRFHSGFDTAIYLHLHRFLAAALLEHEELGAAEPIRSHFGHEMVLARGRKMSKHVGNAISPSSIIRRHGADALRVAMLWAARPHTAIDWRPGLVDRAAALLEAIHDLFTLAAASEIRGSGEGSPRRDKPSKAIVALQRQAERSIGAVGRFVEEYRPNAAIEELAALFRRTESFAVPRLESARLSAADRRALGGILEAESVALSLFAPHLAEEAWRLLGNPPYVVQQRWPFLPGPADA